MATFEQAGVGCDSPENSPKNMNVAYDNDPMNKWGKNHYNAIGDGFEWIG